MSWRAYTFKVGKPFKYPEIAPTTSVMNNTASNGGEAAPQDRLSAIEHDEELGPVTTLHPKKATDPKKTPANRQKVETLATGGKEKPPKQSKPDPKIPDTPIKPIKPKKAAAPKKSKNAVPNTGKNANEAEQPKRHPDADLPEGVRGFFGTLGRRLDTINSRLDTIKIRNEQNQSSLQAISIRNQQDHDELKYIAVDSQDNEAGLTTIRQSASDMDQTFEGMKKWIIAQSKKRKREEYVSHLLMDWELTTNFKVETKKLQLLSRRRGGETKGK